MDTEDRRIVCKVCLKQYSRYICPRCNLAYCSVPCFKQHSTTCTESFYREQAVGAMQGMRADDADKRKVLDILQRFHHDISQDAELADDEQGNSLAQQHMDDQMDHPPDNMGAEQGEHDKEDDALYSILSEATLYKLLSKVQQAAGSSPSAQSLEEVLAGLEIDEADLQPHELKALQRAAASGCLSHMLQPWQPWWLTQEARDLRLGSAGTPVVSELDPSRSASRVSAGAAEQQRVVGGAVASISGLPKPPMEALPSLSSLSRAPPSPLLRWHVLDVLYAYCFVLRMYNGDIEDVADAAAMVLAISATLAAAARPASQRNAPEPAAGGHALGSGAGTTSSAASSELPRLATEAVFGCLTRACQPPVGDSSLRAFAVAVLGDVSALSGAGRSAIILALTHLRGIMEAAAHALHGMEASMACPGGQGASRGRARGGWVRGRAAAAASAAPLRERRQAAQAAARKLLFLSSWANEQDEAVLEAVHGAVEAEWLQHQAAVDVGRNSRPAAGLMVADQQPQQPQQQQGRDRPIIEEMD